MDIVSILIILIVVGAVLYLIENTIPLDPAIKLTIRIIILIVVLLWVLRLFFGAHIPRIGVP